MNLKELLTAVKEQNLDKQQLEGYREALLDVFAKMQFEMADLEKEEAIFMNGKADGESIANRKVAWKATPKGQRLIELKRYATASKPIMDSLKNRIYSFI